ncbi:hypothetical protein ABZY09_26235 [Streptomyces sp. NPDC002928]|uniref:hypothetical protein n=1 Tax=Streptomyces sp. NPDC002928 TaxID=3154440 RepID=UPI0033A7FEF6
MEDKPLPRGAGRLDGSMAQREDLDARHESVSARQHTVAVRGGQVDSVILHADGGAQRRRGVQAPHVASR